MTEIEKELSEYLKQNCEITDIIINYELSKIIRLSEKFVIDDDYGGNDLYITKECRIGDIIINNKKYNIICDIFLEDDEIYFS